MTYLAYSNETLTTCKTTSCDSQIYETSCAISWHDPPAPLQRDTRLRGISCIAYQTSSVPLFLSIEYPALFVASQLWGSTGKYLLDPASNEITTTQAATSDLEWLQDSYENYRISSHFPEHQDSWKLVPRPTQVIQNEFAINRIPPSAKSWF